MRWPRVISEAIAAARATARTAAALPIVESIEARRLLSADLAPALGVIPSYLASGSSHRVAVRVVNVGDAAARGAVRVSLFASMDLGLDGSDVLLGAARKGLKLNARRAARVMVKLNAGAAAATGAGNFHILVRLDGAPAVDADGSNNTTASAGTMTVAAPFVDLAARIIDIPAGSLSASGPAWARSGEARVELFNRGNAAARGSVSISFYLSSDQTLDGGDVLVGAVPTRTGTIKPAHAKRVTGNLVVPVGTPVGTYGVLAVATIGTEVHDADATNNTAFAPGTINVVAQPPQDHGGHDDGDEHHHHHHEHGFIGYGGGGDIFYDDYSTGGGYDDSGYDNNSGGGVSDQPPTDPGPSTQPGDSGGSDFDSSGSGFGDSSGSDDSGGSSDSGDSGGSDGSGSDF